MNKITLIILIIFFVSCSSINNQLSYRSINESQYTSIYTDILNNIITCPSPILDWESISNSKNISDSSFLLISKRHNQVSSVDSYFSPRIGIQNLKLTDTPFDLKKINKSKIPISIIDFYTNQLDSIFLNKNVLAIVEISDPFISKELNYYIFVTYYRKNEVIYYVNRIFEFQVEKDNYSFSKIISPVGYSSDLDREILFIKNIDCDNIDK